MCSEKSEEEFQQLHRYDVFAVSTDTKTVKHRVEEPIREVQEPDVRNLLSALQLNYDKHFNTEN